MSKASADGFTFFDVTTLPATPWKNDGGVTREIVCSPHGADLQTFDWRMSIAQVARDGAFSIFEGVDRTITLLSGNGMRLNAYPLTTIGQSYAFAGETPMTASLVEGETTDFNVMVRRGVVRAEVATQRDSFSRSLSANTTVVVYVISGQWKCAERELPAQCGVIFDSPHDTPTALTCTRTSAAGLALAVTLTPQ